MRVCLFSLLTTIITFSGCAKTPKKTESITLATTTSTRDSGLLDELLPLFEKQTGIRVNVVAVGSGQALELGRRGDADLLLTHAPAAEKEFIKQGFGTKRQLVMHNDFVLVGPHSDPAKVLGEPSITTVFRKISEAESGFLSRGDNSGTHMKEKIIWKAAKVAPKGGWYLEGGSGMAQTLRIASEKRAYTLSDRGTFLSQKKHLQLEIVSEGDLLLKNQYAVLTISPKKHPHLNHAAARKFAEFLLTEETQKVIAKFGVKKYGQPLFFRNPK